MSSRNLVPPRLPSVPLDGVTVPFAQDLVRALEAYIEQERNPGELRGTKVTLTELPTSATGLETGALYRIGNDVKISLLDTAVPDPATATASVGSVSVVTS